jgi:hypothetical protein
LAEIGVCYDLPMRRVAFVVLCAVWTASRASPAGAADDPLARARALYNQKEYEAAVSAAEQARALPSRADAADLVAARAYLERYRASETSDDLTNARDRLRRIDPQRFAPRERAEYVVGLGETLYFDGAPGAAADMFDSVLTGRDLLAGDARDRVLDWWASALDREAHTRSDIERQPIYQRIRLRMEDELSLHPDSIAAPYWIAAAARAQGDIQGAWNAAQAAWVRAPLTSGRGDVLREDLDHLVLRGIVPDRAKATAQPPETLRAQWEQFKERWKR